jgi:uncharacterized protein (DUF111 family)
MKRLRKQHKDAARKALPQDCWQAIANETGSIGARSWMDESIFAKRHQETE